MSASVFSVTKRFKEAIELINGVPQKKLPLLLSRIIASLITSHEAKNKGLPAGDGRVFTEQQEEQLKGMLKLTQAQLDTVVDASSYVLERAAYHVFSAAKLDAQLKGANMIEPQANAFGQMWQQHRSKFLGVLREHTLGGPLVLEKTQWHLNMTLGQSSGSKMKDLNAIYQFHLRDLQGDELQTTEGGNAELVVGEKEKNEKITVEFTQEQLSEFYSKMELISEQLDELSQR